MSSAQNLPAKQQNLNTLNKLLTEMKPQLKMALPRHLTPERLIRVAMTAWQRTPGLQECSPMSILGSIVQAAQLGLEPDNVLGHAYLVPFWNSKTKQKECQLITGYKGLLELARRSGQIEAIESRCVYQKDHFVYRLGLNQTLQHVPSDEEERGPITHAWAIAKFRGGGHQCEVMSKAEIEKVRKSSKAAENGPWVSHYEEMARKTVLRRLCKFLPLSPEIQRQISSEEMADSGIIEATIIEGMETTSTPVIGPDIDVKSKTDKLADKLGAKGNGSPTPAPAQEKEEEEVRQAEPADPSESQLQALKDDLDQRLAEAGNIEQIQEARAIANANAYMLGDWYEDYLERTGTKARSFKSVPLKRQAALASANVGPYANGA